MMMGNRLCKPPRRATLILMGKWVKRHLLNLAFGACAAAALPVAPVEAAASAVLIMYHKVASEVMSMLLEKN